MPKSKKDSVDRRGFLKGAAAGATALVAKPEIAKAQQSDPRRAGAPSPTVKEVAAETAAPVRVEVQTTDRPGADFMVDVLKSLDFEYVCSNPGSSFRGLHESVINYGGNRSPEFITCCHEESATALAHGYAKIEGKPLLVFAHGTVDCSARRWLSTTPTATGCGSMWCCAASTTESLPKKKASARVGRTGSYRNFPQALEERAS
jgi:acetolactate synthase I/II/III large subunit